MRRDRFFLFIRTGLTKEFDKICGFCLGQQDHAKRQFPIRPFSGRPFNDLALPDICPVAVR
jgi:hypothetical protein